MSVVSIPMPPDPSAEPVFRLSVERYHTMIDTGVLTDDDPVELLEGILLFKMPKSPQHRIATAKLQRALPPLIPESMSHQMQEPITLTDGEAETDVAVFRGVAEDYPDRHPGPGDVYFVAEISDSSLNRDRGIKLRSYARAGIATYWIVNLESRCVEVYTNPDTDAASPRYAKSHVFDEKSEVPLELAGQVLGQISVVAILP